MKFDSPATINPIAQKAERDLGVPCAQAAHGGDRHEIDRRRQRRDERVHRLVAVIADREVEEKVVARDELGRHFSALLISRRGDDPQQTACNAIDLVGRLTRVQQRVIALVVAKFAAFDERLALRGWQAGREGVKVHGPMVSRWHIPDNPAD